MVNMTELKSYVDPLTYDRMNFHRGQIIVHRVWAKVINVKQYLVTEEIGPGEATVNRIQTISDTTAPALLHYTGKNKTSPVKVLSSHSNNEMYCQPEGIEPTDNEGANAYLHKNRIEISNKNQAYLMILENDVPVYNLVHFTAETQDPDETKLQTKISEYGVKIKPAN